MAEATQISTQVAPLAGWEKIWLADLKLASDYTSPDAVSGPPTLPNDDLALLISDPWKAVNPAADLPTGYPTTILFFYEEKGEDSYQDTLTAEGICSTNYITVRKPLLAGAAARSMELPFFARSLEISAEPVYIRTIGGLAYAHYHMADDVLQKFAYYYAITRDPRYLANFLNLKEKLLWLDDDTQKPADNFNFVIATDGTFRIIYETLATSSTADDTTTTSGDVIPCIKLVGVPQEQPDGTTIIVNTAVIVPYRTSPTDPPTPDPGSE